MNGVPTLPADGIRWLSFDCFGTLIDWERGIVAAFAPLFRRAQRTLPASALLARYAELEAEAERPPHRPYREVLRRCARGLAERFGIPLHPEDEEVLLRALPRWPPFPDSREALARLRKRYRLAVLSNVDRDLFEPALEALGRPFELVLTASDIGAYKPDPRCFAVLIEATGSDPGSILHAAQSRFHDIAPARASGMRTVWIRRRGRPGAVPPSAAVADFALDSLADLAKALGA